MSFSFLQTSLPGVVLIDPKVFVDERGSFMEAYKLSEFARAGIPERFVQQNHSYSSRGTLRGLHLQREPKAQGKLVRVVKGEIFDVAVDICPQSPTFRRWVSVILSADNRRAVFIPGGYAHGFCVLSAEAEVIYNTTQEYSPELEWGARWDDPLLAIRWPVENPVLSVRDGRWPPVSAVSNQPS